MAGGKEKRRSRRKSEPPIPLEAVDLLAGLAPGVELAADDLPPGIDAESDQPTAAHTSVSETGRLIRAGDRTVRRLIRTTVLRPGNAAPADGAEVDRAGVLPRTPEKPGE